MIVFFDGEDNIQVDNQKLGSTSQSVGLSAELKVEDVPHNLNFTVEHYINSFQAVLDNGMLLMGSRCSSRTEITFEYA